MKIHLNQPTYGLSTTYAQKTSSIRLNKPAERDTVTIGVQARQLFQSHGANNSFVEQLMKQRESLLDMKNNRAQQATESTTSSADLQQQMKEFEKKLAELDAQIAQAQKEQNDASRTENETAQPKTVEEQVFAQAGSLEQTKTLHRMDHSLAREKVSLESEMALDASRGVHSERKSERLTTIDAQQSFVQDTLLDTLDEPVETADNTALDQEKTVEERLQEEAEASEQRA